MPTRRPGWRAATCGSVEQGVEDVVVVLVAGRGVDQDVIGGEDRVPAEVGRRLGRRVDRLGRRTGAVAGQDQAEIHLHAPGVTKQDAAQPLDRR